MPRSSRETRIAHAAYGNKAIDVTIHVKGDDQEHIANDFQEAISKMIHAVLGIVLSKK